MFWVMTIVVLTLQQNLPFPIINNNTFGGVFVFAYTRTPCTRQVRAQFQFPDCYLPSMNPNLKLSEASFVFSHDSATGYIHKGSINRFWWYSKDQIGGIYQQLNDGARAFDLRPKLVTYNDSSTEIIFTHGDIRIPVTLQQIIQEAIQWCQENPDELVLFFPSHFQYKYYHKRNNTQHHNKYNNFGNGDDDEYYVDDDIAYNDDDDNDIGYNYDQTKSLVTVMAEIFQQYGVNYVSCGDVYDLSVGETMELAKLANGGYLLALDGHEEGYASFCAKSNYVEDKIVVCYPNASTSCTNRLPSSSHTTLVQDLRDYVLESVNNEPTDDEGALGPPNDLYKYPFNEIQAIWQVTPASVIYGMARFSNILDDNAKSKINELFVSMVYDGDEYFRNPISLWAMNNVHLNGNAMLSVLRNRCGQSILSQDGDNDETSTCGRAIPPPRLTYWHWSKFTKRIIIAFQSIMIAWIISVLVYYNYYIRGNKTKQQQSVEGHNDREDEEKAFHPRMFFTLFVFLVDTIKVRILARRTSSTFNVDETEIPTVTITKEEPTTTNSMSMANNNNNAMTDNTATTFDNYYQALPN